MPLTRYRYRIKYLPVQYLGHTPRNWQLVSDERYSTDTKAYKAIRELRPAWEAEHGPTLFRVTRTED